MGVKMPLPYLSSRQLLSMAADLDSPLIRAVGEKQALKEQKMLKNHIGTVTMKVIDGTYYQRRSHGLEKVTCLTDVIFDDVRELPVNERVRNMVACRIQTATESKQFNVSFPIRTDLSRLVTEERLASAIARTFGSADAEVYIGQRDHISAYRVVNGVNVYPHTHDITHKDIGGGVHLELEI
jgi:hypothetical protein